MYLFLLVFVTILLNNLFVGVNIQCFQVLKMPSKFVCILRITFSDTQLCGRCLINMTPVVSGNTLRIFCTIISKIN